MGRPENRTIEIGITALLVAAAIFLLVRAEDDRAEASYPPTVEEVSAFLRRTCSYVKAEAALLPIGAHGPPGLAFVRFGSAPSAAAIVSCEVLGDLISWYRFPSAAALREAIARHPANGENELFCVKGDELLIGETPAICRHLGFTIQ